MDEKLYVSDKELNLLDLITYYYNNLVKLIIYFLIPFSIGLGIIFYIQPISGKKENLFFSNLLIQQPDIVNTINKEYLFNARNISEALERANLSSTIKVDANLLNSFDIISGHSELNILVNDYIESDLTKLTQNLYFKPEEIDDFVKSLVSRGNQFKVIVFDKGKLDLNNTEIGLIISNLVDVLNENIAILNDSASITLKPIPKLIIGSPISSIDVNRINNRLILVRDYINLLQNNYLSFAPEINLKVLLSDLTSNEDLFNYIIQKNEIYLDMVLRKIKLEIESSDKRTEVVKRQIDFLSNNFNNDEIDGQNENTSIQADATFIGTILSLGEKASNQTQVAALIDEISILENNKISLESRLDSLNLKSDLGLSTTDAKAYLIQSLNDASMKINEYINTIKDTKKQDESIVMLSSSIQLSEGNNSEMIRQVIMIILGSILFAIAMIALRFLLQK